MHLSTTYTKSLKSSKNEKSPVSHRFTNTSPSNLPPDGDLHDNPDVHVIIQPQHFFNL